MFKALSVGYFVSWLVLSSAALAQTQAPKVTGKQALDMLQAGNHRFVTDRLHGNERRRDHHARQSLSMGQNPHTVVLACADSRVSPELIFDQGLGEMFVVRTAGNTLDTATIASLEYAVEHLGTRLLTVVGHHSCGAVKAALNTPEGKSVGSEHLDLLVGAVRKNIKQHMNKTHDHRLEAPVRSNVSAVAEELMARSKVVRDHVKNKGLIIVPGIYHLESGKVQFWDLPHIAKNP